MHGTVAVSGMAMARAQLILQQETDRTARNVEDVEGELARLEAAKKQCIHALDKLIAQMDDDHREILDFQILLLEDDNYMGQIIRQVQAERVNCEYAVAASSASYRAELMALDNPYLNERAADITDIEQRLLRCLHSGGSEDTVDGPRIVVAEDLTPSQVVELGNQNLKGIILERGGLSSHCVILSRSMDIPCLIGVEGATICVQNLDTVMLDAINGEVTINPSQEQLDVYSQYIVQREAEQSDLEQYRTGETHTKDGHQMRVYANVATEAETAELLKQGGEGIGLMRTEMLYMERNTPPDEETQFRIYSKIVNDLQGRPVIIRTLDVGGDKHIPYLGIPEEENPFLGYRAIRYCLDNPEILRTQAAAVLRAAVHGPAQLMIPMISSVSELEQAKTIILETRAELQHQGIPCGDISIGMMVETPAAAVMADQFAKLVDFFSIGTNDLTQYLFAADRNNVKVAALNSYFQPALLRVLLHVCQCARDNGIEVDICGQAGEVNELIPLWVGMGVDNLSVSIPSIPRVRRTISQCDTALCRKLVDKAVQCSTSDEVQKLIGKEVAQWS